HKPAQQFLQLVLCAFRQAFSFYSYAHQIAFRFRAYRNPFQLRQQCRQLRRTQPAGSLSKRRGSSGILPQNRKHRRACQSRKMFPPLCGRTLVGLLEKIRGVIRPSNAVASQKSEERFAARSTQRNRIQRLSIRSLQRSKLRRISLDFFSIESSLCHRKRRGVLPLPVDGHGQSVEIALVVESRRLQELCIIAIDCRLWCPTE